MNDFKKVNNTSNDDFEYDNNGNLIIDRNKNITNITYNHLNLPVKITFDNSSQKYIEYIYTATGEKLQKTVKHNDSISNTRYLHGFQYYDNVLQFFHTPEGYVKNTPDENGNPSFDYVYQYRDHLGNVRVSYAQDPDPNTVGGLSILEESHYYPFGLQHSNYNTDLWAISRKEEPTNGGGNNSNNDLKTLLQTEKPHIPIANPGYQYKYNGMELQTEFGVEMYDFGARNYDPAIGRWMNIDPLAEMFWSKSPYLFAFNNPIYYIDPDGRSPVINMASVASVITDTGGTSSLGNMNQLGSGLLENENVMGVINLGSRNLQNKSNQNCVDCNFDGGELEPVDLGVIKSKKKKEEEEKHKEGCDDCPTVWGSGIENIGHRVGTRKGSIDTNDFAPASSGRSFTNLIVKWFQKMFDIAQRAENISTKYGPNQSTMETNNEEPVEPPEPGDYYIKKHETWTDGKRAGPIKYPYDRSKGLSLDKAKQDSTRLMNKNPRNSLRVRDSVTIHKFE